MYGRRADLPGTMNPLPKGRVMRSSGVCHALNSGPVPYRESACYGKKNDDNDGEAGLTVRMYHHIEDYNQSLQKGKADYHQY